MFTRTTPLHLVGLPSPFGFAQAIDVATSSVDTDTVHCAERAPALRPKWRVAAKIIGENFGAHAFLPAFHTVYPQLFEGLVLRLPGVVFSHANFLMPRENHLRLASSRKMSNYL
jgi:hypothetical protein